MGLVISTIIVVFYLILTQPTPKEKMENLNRKRPVEFTTGFASNQNVKESTLKTFKGVFHQWGSEGWEGHENLVQHTVGIIETEDGQIHSVDPSRIKFTDK